MVYNQNLWVVSVSVSVSVCWPEKQQLDSKVARQRKPALLGWIKGSTVLVDMEEEFGADEHTNETYM